MRSKNKFLILNSQLLIIRDEWRRVWHDEGVVLIVVFALFIYSILYSLGYGGEVLNEVPVAVVGGNSGSISRTLANKLNASPKICVAHEPSDISEAEQLLAERKVWGVPSLPTSTAIFLPSDRAELLFLEMRVTFWPIVRLQRGQYRQFRR